MIYVRLAGGLGNQLYQISAAAILAQKTKCQVIAFINGLQNYSTIRNPDIQNIIEKNEWLNIENSRLTSIAYILSENTRIGRFVPYIGVNDKNYWFQIKRIQHYKTFFMDGYFQKGWTQESFCNALDLIRPKPIQKAARIRIDENELAIHIRGGDFRKLSKYQVINEKYYIKAIKQAIKFGYTNFAIITDDTEYAEYMRLNIQTNIPSIKIRLVNQGKNAIEDFDTLRCASARIISNSTFAWWATALGNTLSPTWTPNKLSLNVNKDFFLKNEKIINLD
jgi:hypothetical protein